MPSVDDAEVLSLLKGLLEDEPMMRPVTVKQAVEMSFDAALQKRMGQCTITTKFGEEKVPYKIDWQDRSRGLWQVQILDRLPMVHAPEVLGLVKTVLEDEWIRKANRNDLAPLRVQAPIQTSYDAVRQQRTGSATVRTAKGEVPITFVIEWAQPNRKLFHVQVLGNPP